MWTNCAWEFASQPDPGEAPLDLKQSMWQKQTLLVCVCVCMWSLFFKHDLSFQHLICSHKLNVHVFFFSFQSSINPLNPSSESYLPPFKGFIGEDAVLPGHQRVDGLIEALDEPGVVLQLRHALSTGAQPFGEKVVRQAKSWLEEVERRIPESVTEQNCCECDDTKQQSKSPDFPPPGHRHVVTVKTTWPETLGAQRIKIASW